MTLFLRSATAPSTRARFAGVLLLAFGLGCGPSGISRAPGLPGDGTQNFEPEGAAAETGKEEPDLWAGKELIQLPPARPATAVSLPEIQRFELKNGLKVIAVHDPSLPVVSMQLALPVGKRDVAKEKVGLEEFAARMLVRGTRTRTAARIASEIEAVGGALGAQASYEATLVSCKTLSQDFKTCISLVPDVVLRPTFPQAEIDIVRRDLLASVRQRLDDAGQLASAHFQSALWNDDHPRGWAMSARTIDAISRDDLVQWHKTAVRPDGATLAVAGNFDKDQLKATLERSFATWTGKSAAQSRKEPEDRGMLAHTKGLKIRLVDKPGQTQAHIRVGHLGIAHKDPDFYAATVFNYTLGGGAFASRLMQVVRSKEGKTYGASSSFDRNEDIGAFVAATFTRTPETMATVRLIRNEMIKMAGQGPTVDEVLEAQTNIAGSYALRFETADDVAGAILAAELHGFSDDYVSSYPLRIAEVTTESAREAAERVLDPENAVIVIVGDGAKIEPQLESAGWKYEKLIFTDPVSNWERKAEAAPPAVAADTEALAEARQVLDAALAAKGGDKVAALKSFSWKGTAELSLPGGKAPATVLKRFIAPDKLRLDMEIGGGQIKIVTVLAGKSGWAKEASPRGEQTTEFEATELQALRTQLWRDQELVLLRHKEQGTVVEPLADRTIDGHAQHVIRLTSVDGMAKVTLLIDKKTKMLTGLEYSDLGMDTSERLTDYKMVDGVQIAHTRSTKSPQVDLKMTVQSMELNKKIAPLLFVKP